MIGVKIVIVLISLLPKIAWGEGSDFNWSYNPERGKYSPKSWGMKYPECDGPHQSPINISKTLVTSDSSLAPISFVNYEKVFSNFRMENDGRTLNLLVPEENKILLVGNSLAATYRLETVRFHLPSEHKVKRRQSIGEIEFIHVMDRSMLGDPAKEPVYLVLNVFVTECIRLEANEKPRRSSCNSYDQSVNNMLRTLTYYANDVLKEGERTKIDIKIKLSDLLPQSRTSYIQYTGSLTRPPCYNNVENLILTKGLRADKSQVYSLLKHLQHFVRNQEGFLELQPILSNNRPVQPLNNRPIRLFGSLNDLNY